jgi:hypothetical protein
VQHASLTGSGTTGRTGHDGNLFGGEFFLFHFDRMQKYRARNSSILHTIRISRYLSEAVTKRSKQKRTARMSRQLRCLGYRIELPNHQHHNPVQAH